VRCTNLLKYEKEEEEKEQDKEEKVEEEEPFSIAKYERKAQIG
jgi:hypothetical protein